MAADAGPLPPLPVGSFGAGGWAPAPRWATGKYPTKTAEECLNARASFRQLLIKRYHGVIRAWRAMDTNGDGRLSLFEFLRACQDMGLENARRLWEALDADRSGFVSLDEVDPELSRILGGLAVTIWSAFGTVEKAWRGCFNQKGANRIGPEEFARACQLVGFRDYADVAFRALRTDLASNGISRQEFGFLELWFEEDNEGKGPLHESAELDQASLQPAVAPPPLPKPRNQKTPKQEFKRLLKQTYGNFIRAWREGLDVDHSGELDYKEFTKACKDVGYAGNQRELWKELDGDGNGTVSLRELDEPTAHMLEAMQACAVKRHGTWERAWQNVMDRDGTNRVDKQRFVEGCRVMGYAGNADYLFDLLDMDRAKYLTLETTVWIAGVEAPSKAPPREQMGDIIISGAHKGMTRSLMRKLDFQARDQRLRKERFAVNARSIQQRASLSATSPNFAATAPLFRSSSSGELSPPPPAMARTMSSSGLRGEPAAPDWLRLTPAGAAAASPLSPSGGSAAGRARPVEPLEPVPHLPGKGGWPGSPHRLRDPTWGGSGANSMAARGGGGPGSPLLRKEISQPSLTRWREVASASEGARNGAA